MGLKDFSTRISAAMDAMPEPDEARKLGETVAFRAPKRYSGVIAEGMEAERKLRNAAWKSGAMNAMPEPPDIPVSEAIDAVKVNIAAERERCAKIAENWAEQFASRAAGSTWEKFDGIRRKTGDAIAAEIREPFDAYDAACEEVADHPNMLTIRLGGTTTISIMDPSAMGLTIEEFCSQWVYPVLEMAGMKHASVPGKETRS